MCGFIARRPKNISWDEFLDLLDERSRNWSKTIKLHYGSFYPAFGSAAKQIKNLVIREEGQLKTVDATWWFECSEDNGQLQVNNNLTTFNARNLKSPYWRHAIRHNRAIVMATELGEGKGKVKYLMESESPLLIGAVYRKFSNDLYSTAVITRDSHPRFDQYHDKAFPLFLPNDIRLLNLWLSDEPETHPEIAYLLENPRVFNNLKVTPVKTFKDAVPTGEPEFLEADQDVILNK